MSFIFYIIFFAIGIMLIKMFTSGLKSFCGLSDENKPKQVNTITNVIVGAASVAMNKKGTFINYAKQYLKSAPNSYLKLIEKIPLIVDYIFDYTKDLNYNLADEVDVLEATLYMFVQRIEKDETDNLPVNSSLPIADGFKIFAKFVEEHSLN